MFKIPWVLGRQNKETGDDQIGKYFKVKIIESCWPLRFDAYLLKFEEGSKIPPHTDGVKTGKHYRMNIILKKPKSGGIFKIEKSILDTDRVKIFRPDLYEHSVSEITHGKRYVFSFGIVVGSN